MLARYVSLALLVTSMMTSAAHAEDAVVPNEWDPVRTVGACDSYGPGFALVPGTGTCMRISGQLRYEKTFSSGRPGSSGRSFIDIETRN